MPFRALVAAAIALSLSGAGAQARVTVIDVTALPLHTLSANIRVRKVMGTIGTFAIGDFTAGWKSTPHHHTYEQVNVGVDGGFDIVTPATPYAVGRLRGLMLPSDVQHHNDVSMAKANPVLIEFQSVRRSDFPPEREKVTFPAAAAPVTTPAGLEIDFTPDSSGWVARANGVRLKRKTGTRTAVSAWELPAGLASTVAIAPALADAEQFIYVLEADAVNARSGGVDSKAPAGTLLVNPRGSAPVQVVGSNSRAILLVFEATAP